MKFPKPKRIKDKALTDSFHSKTCVACKQEPQSDPAHIKGRGAHGDDVPSNLLALGRACHTAQHYGGWSYLVDKYPWVEKELNRKGWFFEDLFGIKKLRRKD